LGSGTVIPATTTIPTATVLGAGTLLGAGTVIPAGSTFGASRLFVADDVSVITKAYVPSATTVGNYLVKNLSVISENLVAIAPLTNTYGTGITGNVTVTGNGITLGNTMAASASLNSYLNTTTSLLSTAAISAIGTNTISSYTVSAAGNVDLRTSGAFTVNATLNGPAGNTSTANFTGGDVMTLGTVSSNYGGLVSFQNNGGGKKDMADSVVGGLQIYGPVSFNSSGNITVNKGGDNFGGITADVKDNDSKTITLVESGTSKLVSINATGKKTTINLTSANGSIIEAAGAVLKSGDTSKLLTLTANNGSIVIDQPATNTFAGPVGLVTGTGNATFASNVDTILGNISVSSGGLSVDVTNTGGKSITQAAGSTAYVYGQVYAAAALAGDITLNGNSNRFGAYAMKTGSGNITVTENTTINLQSISTTGNLTLTSNNGSILDSTNASLPVGYANSVVNNGATSVALFSAPLGSITLALPASDYKTVGFTTPNNVSVVDSIGSTILTGSTVGGTFDVTNTASNSITQSGGPLLITGNTSFTAAGGGINLPNTANQFGGIRFTAGAAGATINELSTMNLRSGSSVTGTGAAILNSGASFITSGTGGSSFTGNLAITAQGTITPGAGSLLVVGTLSVNSPSTKDLSALSKSGNLVNQDPVNSGTGAYIPPSN